MPFIQARALDTLPPQPNVLEASNQYSEYTRDPNTVALHSNVLEAETIHMALNTVDRDPKGSADFTGVAWCYTNKWWIEVVISSL